MFARSQVLILLSLALLAGSVQAGLESGQDEAQQCRVSLLADDDDSFSGTLTVKKNPLTVCVDIMGSSEIDNAWTVRWDDTILVDSKNSVDEPGCKVPIDTAKAHSILAFGERPPMTPGNVNSRVTYGGKNYSFMPHCD